MKEDSKKFKSTQVKTNRDPTTQIWMVQGVFSILNRLN